MKKLLFIFLVMIGFGASASEAIVCPKAIVCNFSQGTCNVPATWNVQTSCSVTNGTFTLTAIGAFTPQNSSLSCYYRHGTHGCYIYLRHYIDAIRGGGWYPKGFGKDQYECMNHIDPNQCSGVIN